jgi:hypothetical protein
MTEKQTKRKVSWPLIGIACLAALAAIVVIRHVVNYDAFAILTIEAGNPAPPPFPQWQRIVLASVSAFGFVAALGIILKRSWGVYVFVIAFIAGQTFAFSVGQWGLPSFLIGLSVIVLGMNYLHELK